MPLRDFTSRLLNRRIRYCNHITAKPVQDVTIVLFHTNCWKCNEGQHLWTVDETLKTHCGQLIHKMGSTWSSDQLDKRADIYAAVQNFLATDQGKHLRVGQLKKRYSNTIRNSYLSHGCYSCNSIFGDFFLGSEKRGGLFDPNSIRFTVKIEIGELKQESKHWCYSEDGKFCE